MRRLVLAVVLLLAAPADAANVGFLQRTIPNGTDTPLTIGIWYPTSAAPHPTRISLYTQNVAEGAPLAGRNLPLVVISHGNGGEFAGHSDTAYALAEAGFVAAAPTHTGDNYRDQSRATAIGGRVRALSATIDYVAHGWQPHAIDPNRVGAFGFSAGGLTVLIAAGAQPDFAKIGPHCQSSPGFFDCTLIASHGKPPEPAMPPIAGLRAAVSAAPALGFALTPAGLAGVHIPIQLWRADDDRVLPAAFYADAVRAALPTPPEFHGVPHAGHFDFLAPCPPALAQIAPPICTSEPGFDRAAFHKVLNRKIVDFFKQKLRPT